MIHPLKQFVIVDLIESTLNYFGGISHRKTTFDDLKNRNVFIQKTCRPNPGHGLPIHLRTVPKKKGI